MAVSRRVEYGGGNFSPPGNNNQGRKSGMTPKQIAILVGSALALILFFSISGALVEVNHAGHYHIKQSVGGSLTVINDTGPYWQGMGTITEYPVSDTLYFSKHDEEGGDTFDASPVKVRFNDGNVAEVSGTLRFRLSQKTTDQLTLHRDYRGYETVRQNMIRPMVRAALMQTASLMRAEESYSTRRAEFAKLAEEQVRKGIFDTISTEKKTADVEGNDFIERAVQVATDKSGAPIISNPSPLTQYGIEIVQFTIAEIDFDKSMDDLIAQKKAAEQQKVVARANAEKAKQDAITAEEQGKAMVAKAKAEKDVEKIQAVTAAQKEFEVAEFNKKRDREFAEAQLITQRAAAEANKLLVNAGLTPEKRALIEKDTAIGVAQALATVKFPEIMVIGTGGAGGGGTHLNPFDAVGLDALRKTAKDMATTK